MNRQFMRPPATAMTRPLSLSSFSLNLVSLIALLSSGCFTMFYDASRYDWRCREDCEFELDECLDDCEDHILLCTFVTCNLVKSLCYDGCEEEVTEMETYNNAPRWKYDGYREEDLWRR